MKTKQIVNPGRSTMTLAVVLVMSACALPPRPAAPQAGQVNAITRVLFTVVAFGVFALAFYLVYRAIFNVLPKEEGKSQFESEFWDLMQMWQQGKDARPLGKPAE